MIMKGIKILQEGLLSTFQDAGRIGFANIGLPQGGVMDLESQSIANALVGKNRSSSVLELTGFGVTFQALIPMVIAVTGGKIKAFKNNVEIPMYQSIHLDTGDKVALNSVLEGLRSYVSFSHDMILDKVFESESTYTLSALGGFKGRPLKTGDVIEMTPNRLPKLFAYDHQVKQGPFHVILGYEHEDFDENLLFSKTFKVSTEHSRMGMKLEGEILKAKEGHDIISSPVCPGTIQIPGSGQPIILLRDGQTTGGYKRIGCVIFEDLNRLSQYKAGDQLFFKDIDLVEAKVRKRAYLSKLENIKNELKPIKAYEVTLKEKPYYVTVELKEMKE